MRIHLRSSQPIAFVQLKDQKVAMRIVEENDKKHSIECNGKQFPIVIRLDDNSVSIKLHDVSVEVTDNELKKYSSLYGEVRAVREGQWGTQFLCAGVPDGYRYVTMVLAKPVPSNVTVSGEQTLVSYRGQKQTYKYCERVVHFGMTCIQSHKLMVQKSSVQNRIKCFAEAVTINSANKYHARIYSDRRDLWNELSSLKTNSARSSVETSGTIREAIERRQHSNERIGSSTKRTSSVVGEQEVVSII